MTFSLMGLDYVLLRTMAGDVKQGNAGAARGASRTALLVASNSAIVVGTLLALFGAPMLQSVIGDGLEPGLLLLSGIAVLPLTLEPHVGRSRFAVPATCWRHLWLDGPQAMLIGASVLLVMLLSKIPLSARDVVLLYFTTAGLNTMSPGSSTAANATMVAATVMPAIPLLRQGSQISFIVLSRMLIDWVVLVALSVNRSTFEVGQFRTAWQIAALIMLLVTTFDTVAGPRIAAAYRVRDIDDIRRIMRQQVGTMSLISLPLFVLTLGFPELGARTFRTGFRWWCDGFAHPCTGPDGQYPCRAHRRRAADDRQ